MKYLRDPLSRFTLHLLKETLRPHLPTCVFPDFLQLPPDPHDLGCYRSPRIPVPLGWHFVFFPSIPDENALLADGYDPVATKILLSGRSRRRWRGGELLFGDNHLLSEEPGKCVLTEAVSAVGNEQEWERVDEHQVRRLYNSYDDAVENDEAVIEKRHLVYLPVNGEKTVSQTRAIKSLYEPLLQTSLIPTRTLVFRFSALTFNAHRIHYDPAYATSVEHLPDVIVQGALSLVLVMSWVQFNHEVRQAMRILGARRITAVRYSCVQNILVDRELKMFLAPVVTTPLGPDKWRIWLEQDGGVCFKGLIRVQRR